MCRRIRPQWAAGDHRHCSRAHRGAGAALCATRPAMIVLGGSSMHKGANGWQAGRAIACLPALTGNVGIPGGGFGPRHGSAAHGRGLGSIIEPRRRAPGTVDPQPDVGGHGGAARRPHRQPAADGHQHAVVVRRRRRRGRGPGADAPGRELRPVPERHGAPLRRRRAARHRLAGGTRLQDDAHAPLPDGAGARAAGRDALAATGVMRNWPSASGSTASHPWASEEAMVDAILDHPCTGHATVAALRAEGGIRALNVSHVANPTLEFDTPSRKIEFYSEQARAAGPAAAADLHAPAPAQPPAAPAYPLALTQGRTLAHFHASTTTAGSCRRSPGASASRRCGSRPPTPPRAGSPTARRSASSTSAASSPRARTSPIAFPPAPCGCATAGPVSTLDRRRAGAAGRRGRPVRVLRGTGDVRCDGRGGAAG